MTLEVALVGRRPLRFDDGRPVRSASAVAGLGRGWLIAQDDATAGAFLERHDATTARRIRLLPPVDGRDVFSEASGTKRSKPDLEAGLTLPPELGGGVLLLGSGSLANRRHGVVVGPRAGDEPDVAARDLGALYDAVVSTLAIPEAELNLEGACLVGTSVRWFQRGRGEDVPSASVDVDLGRLVAAVRGEAAATDVDVAAVRRYDLGRTGDVPWAVTDAVTIPGGRILVSVSAEDTDDPVADGPVSGSGLALLDGSDVLTVAPLPSPSGVALKLEGLAVVAVREGGARLLGVVDQDDPTEPSLALDLEVDWS